MFENLQDGIRSAMKSLRGKGKLTEANMRDGLALVEQSLLEADVSYDVVKDFMASVSEQALGRRVLLSLDPSEEVVGIVRDELIKLLGPVDPSLHLKKDLMILMLCGLQGSGKTTTCGKLAKLLQNNKVKPMLVAADLQRPAAIDQLQTLNQIAFHEDIHDPVTIRKLSQLTETPQKLDMLMLMSYAELNAVAPGTWTSWKNRLLTEVWHRTRNYMERPESLEERPQTTRQAVYAKLAGQCSREVIDQHLETMPDDYLRTADADDIVMHIRLVQEKGDREFAMGIVDHSSQDYFDLILCGQSNSGLFKNLVGTLTARALDILSAQIFSRKDGLALIIAQIGSSEAISRFGSVEKVGREIEQDLTGLIDGSRTLGVLLKERTRLLRESRGSGAIVPRVQIENHSENPFTLVRIEARDHTGMLYKIAHAFRAFGIRPHRATIATRGGRGTDVFSVSLDGRKITFPPLIQRIKDTLVTTLLVEKIEELD